jgi:hypothetical protein
MVLQNRIVARQLDRPPHRCLRLRLRLGLVTGGAGRLRLRGRSLRFSGNRSDRN